MKKLTLLFLFFACLQILFPQKSDSRLSYYVREASNPELSPEDAMAVLDSSIRILFRQNDSLSTLPFLLKKAELYSSASQHYESYQTYNLALNLVRNFPDSASPAFQNKILLSLAKESRRLGLLDESAKQCFELLASPGVDKDHQIMALSMLSIVFRTMGNPRDANKYAAQADQLFDYRVSGEAYISYLNGKAGIAWMDGKHDSSIFWLNKALDYLNTVQDDEGQRFIIQNNLANVYYDLGEYDIAKRNYETVFSKLEGKPDSYYKAECLLNLAKIEHARKQTARATALYLQSMEMAGKTSAWPIKGMAQIGYSNLLYGQGKYKESRNMLDSGYRLLDFVKENQNAAKVNILKNNFETRELQKDKTLLQQDLKILSLQNKWNRTLLVALVLLLCASAWAIVSLINKIRSGRQNSTSLRYELHSMQKAYDSSLDRKEDQLLQLGQMMVKTKNTLEQIGQEVAILQNTGFHPEKLHETLSKINNSIVAYKQEPLWHSLEHSLDKQARDFRENILEQFPGLSANEVQICLLLALDMCAKDIALFQNKAVRTVESSIYRLRKKLDIPSEFKTHAFLKQYLPG